MMVRRLFWLLAVLLIGAPLAWAQGQLINGNRVITGTLNAATTSGTPNNYLLTLNPAITQYVLNQCFTFRVHATNTGPPTLNINGVGAVALKRYVTGVLTPLAVGELPSGQIFQACYDGTALQLTGAGGGTSTSGGAGFNVVDAGADPTGVADSTPAFVSLLGKHMYVPPGTFLVGHLVLTDNTTIECSGQESLIKLLPNQFPIANDFWIGSSYLAPVVNNITIKNCQFDANKANGNGSGSAISIAGFNVLVEGNVIRESAYACVLLGRPSGGGNMRLLNNHCLNPGIGSTGWGAYGIAGGTNIVVEGNTATGGSPSAYCIDVEPNNGWVVDGIALNANVCNDGAILLRNAVGGTLRNAVVTGNYADATGAFGSGPGCKITNVTDRAVFVGNTCVGPATTSGALDVDASSNVTIVGNTLSWPGFSQVGNPISGAVFFHHTLSNIYFAGNKMIATGRSSDGTPYCVNETIATDAMRVTYGSNVGEGCHPYSYQPIHDALRDTPVVEKGKALGPPGLVTPVASLTDHSAVGDLDNKNLWSDTFNGHWTLGLGLTVTDAVSTDPLGGTTAARFVANAAGGPYQAQIATTQSCASGDWWNMSFWIKATSGNPTVVARLAGNLTGTIARRGIVTSTTWSHVEIAGMCNAADTTLTMFLNEAGASNDFSLWRVTLAPGQKSHAGLLTTGTAATKKNALYHAGDLEFGGTLLGGTVPWSRLGSGQNTTGAMVCGTGCSMTTTGLGQIVASDFAGSANYALKTGVNQRITGTQVTPRIVAQTVTGGVITPNIDTTDTATVDALAVPLTINAPTGTGGNPAPGHELILRFKSSTQLGLTWNAIFAGENGAVLPTSTSGTDYDYLKFVYNATSAKWGLVATTLGQSKGVTTLTSSRTYTCPWNTSSLCEMQMTETPSPPAVAMTVAQPIPTTGMVNGTMLRMAFMCTNDQALTWNGIFTGSRDVALPSTCPQDTTKWMMVGVQWSTFLNKWQLMAVNFGSVTGGGAVSSVFGRTGAVVAAANDYTAAQVQNAASITASNSWQAGIKQTFAPNATFAGLNVGSLAGDPSTLANGDLWYDSTANELTARINGATVSLGSGVSFASNPADCPIPGTFPVGVDAAGIAENCKTLSAVNPKTGAYTVTGTDFDTYTTITVASGTFALTLVPAGQQPVAGKYIRVINYGAGVVTITPNGQSMNGGANTLTLTAGSGTAPTAGFVLSDGVNYFGSTTSAGAGSGTVTAGTVGAATYYPAATTTVNPSTALTMSATEILSARLRATVVTAATATLGVNDGPVVRCDANANTVALTLPAASGTQRTWKIQKVDASANACTITRGGTDTINGGTTPITLSTQWERADLDVTNSGSPGSWGSTVSLLTVGSAQLAPKLRTRTCMIVMGADDAAAPLVNANLGPQLHQCRADVAMTVTEIAVYADAGTPSVIVHRRTGTTNTALLSSALTTAAAGAVACSKAAGGLGLDGATTCSGTVINASIPAGHTLGLTSGTAGGTAKRMSIAVTMTID